MNWFEGSIPAAIQAAKNKPSVLVVYITGQDDVSKQMDQTWDDESVSQAAEVAGFISLKLEAKSDECAQFSMIYPVVCVPCTFFVGNNGVPLEVLGGNVTATEFVEKIHAISQQSKSSCTELPKIPSPQPTTDTTRVESETSHPVQQINNMAVDNEEGPSTSTDNSATNMDVNDKVERAKELVTMKKVQKVKEEEEKAKASELERRKLGKDLASLQKFKDEQQQKETLLEWKKEKEDQKRERDRVKEQLEQDRAERAVRYNREKQDRENTSKEAKRLRLEESSKNQAETNAKRRETARIQFRLPDGSSVTNQFSSSETLGSARNFLLENVQGRFGNIVLSTIYPRRTFNEENMMETLLDLDLAPSAIIVVLPAGRTVVSRRTDGSQSSFIWMLLGPFIAIWNFICGFLFTSPSQPRGEYNNQSPPEDSSSAQSSSQTESRSQSRSQSRPSGIRTRQQGNIRRLTAMDDDDDEDNATWNGNSTQQM